MNTISHIQNYNRNTTIKRQNVQFTGNLGDKFVKDIINDIDIKPKDLIKEMKSTFGIKTDKAEDILESFIGKIKQLYSDKRTLKADLQKSNDKISLFPKEKQAAIQDAESRLYKDFQETIRFKDGEITAKNKELKEMKSQLEKYQQVAKVKSVEEIGTIMPDRAIEIADELAANKISARKSMAEFLFNGKGQENALAQIERNNMLMKAARDEITEIPEVAEKLKEMRESGIYFGHDTFFTLRMIEKALKGSPKGSYIKSYVIKNQIKENAMALLRPMADERYSNTGVKSIEQELDKCLNDIEKYYDELNEGIRKFKDRIGKDIKSIEYKTVEFSPEESNAIITMSDGTTIKQQYQWIANYGKSNW